MALIAAQKKIWFNGKLVDWEDAKIHVLSSVIHFGSGCFEGARCYETGRGGAVFRLGEHIDRLLHSAAVFLMKMPFTRDQICAASLEVIKANGLKSCYVRPVALYGYGAMGLDPREASIDVAVAVWPWAPYLGDETIRVCLSSYVRNHPRAIHPDAKISGYYVNSLMATMQAHDRGYVEALLLDHKGHVAEGAGENLFIVKNRKIYTPPLGNILPGITRASVMEIAGDLGYVMEEKVLMLEDVKGADEVFFTGTACEVTAIGELDDQPVGTGKCGPVTRELRSAYLDIVQGRNGKYSHWLTYVEPGEA